MLAASLLKSTFSIFNEPFFHLFCNKTLFHLYTQQLYLNQNEVIETTPLTPPPNSSPAGNAYKLIVCKHFFSHLYAPTGVLKRSRETFPKGDVGSNPTLDTYFMLKSYLHIRRP